MNERINISVRDRISSSIARKFERMAISAERLDRAIDRLPPSLRNAGAAGTAASGGIDRFNRSATRTNRGIRVVQGRISGLIGTMRNLLVVSAAIGAGGGLLRGIDSSREIRNRISAVTGTQDEADAVRGAIFDLASEVRAPVNSVVTAYQRFDKALSRVGASQGEVLDFTRTLVQSLKIAGSSATEVESTILQLGQALTKGNLDGEELRALRENAPIEVMEALANVMGVNVGELKELGREGRITTSVIRQAFRNLRSGVQTDFDNLVPTIGESFTVLLNRIIQQLDEFEQRSGFFASISNGILFMANNLDLVLRRIQGLAAGFAVFITGRVAITAVTAVVGILSTALAGGAGAMTAMGVATTFATGGLNILLGVLALSTAALVGYRDEIILSERDSISLGTVMRTEWENLASSLEGIAPGISAAMRGIIAAFTIDLEPLDIIQISAVAVAGHIGALAGVFAVGLGAIRNNVRIMILEIQREFLTGFAALGGRISETLTPALAAINAFFLSTTGRPFFSTEQTNALNTFVQASKDGAVEVNSEIQSIQANTGAAAQATQSLITSSLLEGIRQRRAQYQDCLLYTSPSPRDRQKSRMPSSA